MPDRTLPPHGATRTRRSLLRLICPAYPTFNIYTRPGRVMTALGPVCVASTVSDIAGWDAEIIDENNYHHGPVDSAGKVDHDAIQQARPADVIGFYGGLTSTIPRLLELAETYRKQGLRTIAGGQHFVADNAEHALRNGVDVVVLGEGERTITELLRCFEEGGDLADVAGIAYLDGQTLVVTEPREPMNEFDTLPLPDFSLLRFARLKFYPVSGTRGCRMQCEFCSVKGTPRFARPERMMQQFAAIYERWRGTIFFVVDDLFGQNRQETLTLCALLAKYQKDHGVRFSITVQIRLDMARDSELLAAMRQANINILAIGFESPVAAELESMSKHLKAETMLELVELYHRAGFRIHGMFIFGYPSKATPAPAISVEERVRAFRRFIRKAKLATVQVLLPIPLPGTEFFTRLKAQDRVLPIEQIGLEYYDGNFPVIVPDAPLTPESMQASAQKIMRHLYHPRTVLQLGWNVLSLPAVLFQLHRLESAWGRWYRRWLVSLYRVGGWLLQRQWTSAFKKGDFPRKLNGAKRLVNPPAR
jgi:radical SAM superfamily enzyme YgiQ (UPF0313 family)